MSREDEVKIMVGPASVRHEGAGAFPWKGQGIDGVSEQRPMVSVVEGAGNGRAPQIIGRRNSLSLSDSQGSTPRGERSSIWAGRLCTVLSNMPDTALVVSGGMKLALAMGHAVPVHCRVALAATEVLSGYVACVKIFGSNGSDSLLGRAWKITELKFSLRDLYETAVASVTAGMACIGISKICAAASKTVEWAGRIAPKLYLLGGRLIRWTWYSLRLPLVEHITKIALVTLGCVILTVGRLAAWISDDRYDWNNECYQMWRNFGLSEKGSFQQHVIGCAKHLSAIGVVVAGGAIPIALCTILQGGLGILQDTHRRMVVAA